MSRQAIAKKAAQQVSRPLKVLIPLIQRELQLGDSAGREHYRNAGDMLIESKGQVAYGGWGRWLSKNFELSQSTARRYMQWARNERDFEHGVTEVRHESMRQMTGETARRREAHQSKQQEALRRAIGGIAREDFVQERQARDDEVKLHRDLAEELVDIGYRALATKLHPDRGGTQIAMARLNRVRDELKSLAQNRRFV
jgi:hypothetical protein